MGREGCSLYWGSGDFTGVVGVLARVGGAGKVSVFIEVAGVFTMVVGVFIGVAGFFYWDSWGVG